MGPADLGDGAAAPIVLSGVSVPTDQSDLIVASALIALTVLMENSGLAGVSEPLVAAPVSIVLTAASDRATAAAVPGRNVLIVVSASLALARHAVMVSAVTMNLPLLKVLPVLKSMI